MPLANPGGQHRPNGGGRSAAGARHGRARGTATARGRPALPRGLSEATATTPRRQTPRRDRHQSSRALPERVNDAPSPPSLAVIAPSGYTGRTATAKPPQLPPSRSAARVQPACHTTFHHSVFKIPTAIRRYDRSITCQLIFFSSFFFPPKSKLQNFLEVLVSFHAKFSRGGKKNKIPSLDNSPLSS